MCLLWRVSRIRSEVVSEVAQALSDSLHYLLASELAPSHNAENEKEKRNEETTLYIGCCFDAPGWLLKAGGHVLTTSGDAESFDE
jgi:hypothetical protein